MKSAESALSILRKMLIASSRSPRKRSFVLASAIRRVSRSQFAQQSDFSATLMDCQSATQKCSTINNHHWIFNSLVIALAGYPPPRQKKLV
jgi:hypothetical protein